MRQNIPPKENFLRSDVRVDGYPKYVISRHIASGNNGHLFLATDESIQGKLAFKFVPVNNLPNDPSEERVYLNEAKTANLLGNRAAVQCLDVVSYFDELSSTDCIVFVNEYVEGKNLREYIERKANHSSISISFIEDFLRTILDLLLELRNRNLQHGDLHAGNVLVSTNPHSYYQSRGFRVTDFGVRNLASHADPVDDYLSVGRILNSLLECINYEDLDGRERFVFNCLKDEFLARHLFELNRSIDEIACDPRRMLSKLDSLNDRYLNSDLAAPSGFMTPFDYPNCEQIGERSSLLQSIYSDRLLGLDEIKSFSNLVLTGPRGCGKTTVFRALSLEHLMSVNADVPSNMKYIGIYYRCDELYFAFPRYEKPGRAEALDLPMHFLTVTLLAKLLEQVDAWAKRHYTEEYRRKEFSLVTELKTLFEWIYSDDESLIDIVGIIRRLKTHERKRVVRKQRFAANRGDEPITNYFGPDIIGRACSIIRSHFSFLYNLRFFFFIDDYSHPKITKTLQQNLNRALMHRSPDVFFKVSTESPVSFSREDIDGKKFVESREFTLLNLGLRYIMDSGHLTAEFLRDLFARRFGQVKEYPVKTLEQLLGSVRRNENATARFFREHKRRRGKHLYAGCETVELMCSGDIHYVISLVRRMVEHFGGKSRLSTSDSAPRIPRHIQDDVVRLETGAFIESIRTLPRNGAKLAEVVTAFGNVARSYLMHADSSNDSNNPPHQTSRIEPYESLHLSSEAQEILDELLRYSILIEDPRGMSRRNHTVPRFYLRRYLIPRFRLTFSRRDSLEQEGSEIELLLLRPLEFEKRMRKSGPDRIRHHNPAQEVLEL